MYCFLLLCMRCLAVFFYGYGEHLDVHGLTHSFPTRRSSDLALAALCAARASGIELADAVAALQDFSGLRRRFRSEEHTSELQSLMRISYAVFCLKKKKKKK